MKILHSSDWHLGARTGGIDRTDDLFCRIDELRRLHEERLPGFGWIDRQRFARSGAICGKSATWIEEIHAELDPALHGLVAVWSVAVDNVAEQGVLTDRLRCVRRWAGACVLRCV